jgi:hypothetical protein
MPAKNKKEEWREELKLLVDLYRMGEGNWESIESFISAQIRQARQQEAERIAKIIKKVRKTKFKRGERKWCVECADRIVGAIKSQILNRH